jgi:acetyl-CoA carboxylase carboxyl transferase subunit beta
MGDAMEVAVGKVDGNELLVACMDFAFIGGSMGSVVGEKIARSIDHCIEHHTPLLIISKSGGARMMEGAFSLMQMAKTSSKLTQLAQAQLPFISLLTDPTTGGVTASFAMLGDVIIAEPGALIGFAGPRVIKETIKKDLPEGFQQSEFLLEKGFLDLIVDRKTLKESIAGFLVYFAH